MPFGEPIDFLSGGYGELGKQGGRTSWLDALGTESIGRRQKIITYISVGLVLVIFGSHVSLLVNEGWPPPLGLCKIPPVCPTTVLRVWWAGRRLCARLVYYVSVLVEKWFLLSLTLWEKILLVDSILRNGTREICHFGGQYLSPVVEMERWTSEVVVCPDWLPFSQ